MTSSIKILALDTAANCVSAVLLGNGTHVQSASMQTSAHSENIIPFVKKVLEEAGITLADVSAVAFGAGPGAFTGLRVACGTAQGLAWASDKPVVSVSNIAATALNAFGKNPEACGTVLVANDARMHECYVGIVKVGKDGTILEEGEPELLSPAMLSERIAEVAPDFLAGSAFAVYAAEIDTQGRSCDAAALASALEVARIAVAKYEAGQTITPAQAAPLYVRNRVALTIEERKLGQKL